jgi:hypothetical protein
MTSEGEGRTTARNAPNGRARNDARAEVVQAWKRAGWPRPPWSPRDYARLKKHMAAYLAIVFPEIDELRRDDLVGRTLDTFMAPLHARRPRHYQRDPEELVQALEDAALDRAEETPRLGSGRNDGRVTSLAFSASPERVRIGLAALAAAGDALDYQVVTKYLDLVDLDPTRPPSSVEVAAGLRPAEVTEHRVRQVLLDFRRRVEAVVCDDDA